MHRLSKLLQNPFSKIIQRNLQQKDIVLVCSLFFLVLHWHGCCDDIQEIESLTKSTIDTIFAPWIRKAALGFGGGFGLFQAYMNGSVRPLLTWGGLGLVVNYIPKLIDIVSNVGG